MTAMAEVPDTVTVAGHYGFVDAVNRTVLFSVTNTEDAEVIPERMVIEGEEYTTACSTLPLVGLTHGNVVPDVFNEGKLLLLLPEGEAMDYCSEFRYRGVTALSYTKKSYAIKLKDVEGNSLDSSLLGMRKDNNWILDAMACDVSRMRNRVSTDLWLDFSQRPYYADSQEPEMYNGTHGKFVEVFVNKQYWGLYCLTEKIDRKQLKVKKFRDGEMRGAIYKLGDYDNMSTIFCEPDDAERTWQGWEGTYPDVRKGEPWNWGPLYNLYTFLGQDYKTQDVIDHFSERVDIPLWTDYILYCDLMHATDNGAKNLIVYFRDITSGEQQACICPWDLDATWGRAFDASKIAYDSNCVIPNVVNAHLLMTMDTGYANMVFRWRDLRKTYLNYDHIWPYFERYFQLFESSGAAARETARWQDVDGIHLDFKEERRYIRSWMDYRLHYLDLDYSNPDGVACNVVTSTSLPVYNLQGQIIGHCSSVRDLPSLRLSAGIYIFGGRKIRVK